MIILLVSLTVGLWVWGYAQERGFDLGDRTGTPLLIVLAVVTGMASLFALLNLADFRPRMAAIAQVRQAVATVDCKSFSASQILGQALDVNQEIVSSRAWNQRFLTDGFIADGWDTVSFVVLPTCEVAP